MEDAAVADATPYQWGTTGYHPSEGDCRHRRPDSAIGLATATDTAMTAIAADAVGNHPRTGDDFRRGRDQDQA
jgi:hypothetical protein